MKMLSFLLLALSLNSHGAELCLDNKSDGQICFTDQDAPKCDQGKQSFAYIVSGSGQIELTGCWSAHWESGKAIVIWADDTVYQYKLFNGASK